jgi:hypothetical protein
MTWKALPISIRDSLGNPTDSTLILEGRTHDLNQLSQNYRAKLSLLDALRTSLPQCLAGVPVET